MKKVKEYIQKRKKYKTGLIMLAAALLVLNAACVGHYLPDELDAYDKEAGFTAKEYVPQLGRTQLMTNNWSDKDNSTLPYTFEITNIMRWDGSPAPELTEFYPVKVWKQPYSGLEKSLAEIEAKREIEYRRLFDVRKHSGEFILWANANSSFVLCQPDSCYVFDVLTQNSGGYNYTTRMRLLPQREVDFEPTNTDPQTGLAVTEYIHPTSVTGMRIINPNWNFYFPMAEEDVKVYFRKVDEKQDPEKTLTFRFFSADYTPIDPAKFNTTSWETLLHGFDLEKTTEYVRYKVAYPMPLITAPTSYTNTQGDRISAVFSYDRINTSGRRTSAEMALEFAIYTEAHWEILFVFSNGDPLFEDYA